MQEVAEVHQGLQRVVEEVVAHNQGAVGVVEVLHMEAEEVEGVVVNQHGRG